MTEPNEQKSRVSMMPTKSRSNTRSLVNTGQSRASLSRVKIRRTSYGFTGVPGVRPIERTSQVAIEFKRPPLLFLNTYQLDPHEPWHVPSVTKAAEETLDELFTGHKYNVQESPALALRVAGDIMRKVKALCFNRYRVISVVTVGQKRAQSYNNAITFLWDYDRDNYVDTQRETTTAFIQVTVFGVHIPANEIMDIDCGSAAELTR